MPVNVEEIRKAMDSFETEDYISAKEILQQEIHQAKNTFLRDKLGLEKFAIPPVVEEEVEEVEEACGAAKGKKKKKMAGKDKV